MLPLDLLLKISVSFVCLFYFWAPEKHGNVNERKHITWLYHTKNIVRHSQIKHQRSHNKSYSRWICYKRKTRDNFIYCKKWYYLYVIFTLSFSCKDLHLIVKRRQNLLIFISHQWAIGHDAGIKKLGNFIKCSMVQVWLG